MLMQPAIGDQKNLTARNLAVEHTRDTYTPASPTKIASQFDDEFGFREIRRASGTSPARLLPMGPKSSRVGLRGNREYRNRRPYSATDRTRCIRSQSAGEVEGIAVRFHDRFRLEVLRAGENVKSMEIEGSSRMRLSMAGTRSASTPNCLGPPPIFMPEDLSSKSGLTRTAALGAVPRLCQPWQGAPFPVRIPG
jgi:hypothetical protein